MSDPVEFLKTRLDETEALVREIVAEDASLEWTNISTCVVETGDDLDGLLTTTRNRATHIAHWDPASVLWLVAATRALLELHHVDGLGSCPSCAELDPEQRRPGWIVLNPCDTVIELAKGWGWVDE